MFKKSITLRLTFGFLTIVVISTLLIGVISLSIFKNNIFQVKRNNMKKHAHEVSYVIAPLLEKSLNAPDTRNILNIIDSFSNSKVWIVDINSKLMTISDSANTSNEGIDNSIREKLAKGVLSYDDYEKYNPQ